MPDPEPFVDIHCHILPDIDDGAAGWEDSLAMARLAVADGISTVVATPHQLGNYRRNHGQAIRTGCQRLQEFLRRHGVALHVLPGADVRIDPDMIPKIHTGQVVTLADRRQYVLLELPHELYLPLDSLLAQLDAAGLVGILSHPERNLGMLGQPHLVEALVDADCLMQLTAGSLLGLFGSRVKDLAECLLSQGLVHFIATDAHGWESRRPLMSDAFHRAIELAGGRAALEICCENPARVVAGESVVRGRRNWKGRRWFRWRKAG